MKIRICSKCKKLFPSIRALHRQRQRPSVSGRPAKKKFFRKLKCITEVLNSKSVSRRKIANRISKMHRKYQNLFVSGDICSSDDCDSDSIMNPIKLNGQFCQNRYDEFFLRKFAHDGNRIYKSSLQVICRPNNSYSIVYLSPKSLTVDKNHCSGMKSNGVA